MKKNAKTMVVKLWKNARQRITKYWNEHSWWEIAIDAVKLAFKAFKAYCYFHGGGE